MVSKKEKYSTDIESRIKSNYGKFSKGHKLIANYILNNLEDAAFLTATNLGKRVGISVSTVVRFPDSLEYNDYSQLQKDLQKRIKERLNTINRLKYFFNKTNDIERILYEVSNNDIKNIQKIINSNSTESLRNFVNKILNSNSIHIVGLKNSASLACLFGYSLNYIVKNVHICNFEVNSLFEKLSNLDERDLLIGISFRRYTRQTIEVMDCAKNRGIKTAAITDVVTSPLAQLADISVFAETKLNYFIESYAAPTSLINSIIVLVGMKRKKEIRNSLTKLEKIWEKYKIFF